MSGVVPFMRLSPLSVLPVLAALVVGTVLSGGPAAGVAPSATGPALSWDFDGDGIRDLAAGQVGNEEGGPGQVLVRRGTADGYGPATVLRHPEAPEGNEGFGSSLASADLDLDGYADLVVGAPGFYPQPDGYGSVTVFHGSPAGLSQAAATSTVWPRRTDGDLVSFGRSVVIAFLDGDQWPDLAVGAPDDDGDNRGIDRSSVVLLRGGPAGFSAARSSTVPRPADTKWFGQTLAAGDVDRDGHVDLVESSSADTGRHIAWLRGTASGPRTAKVISSRSADSIAIGKVTGDRFPDVVTSRPYARYDPTTRKPYVGVGSVTLFRGSASGPRAGVTATQESRGVPGSSAYGDFFGASVTIADVNHNGRNEVVVGVPGRDVGGIKDAGAITLLRVGRTSFRTTGNRTLTQVPANVPGEPGKFDNFGRNVSAQDRTGDGVPDVLVASRVAGSARGVLTVLRVVDGPLASAPGTAWEVLDGALPRDASTD
jgi:FG-GAP repeat